MSMPCLTTITDEANNAVLGNFGTVLLDNGCESFPPVVLAPLID
jgi:hypothetical protein